ncbi:hypothetical protein HDF13_003817 [Edaphobacter lichenicola]|uniref:Uncharacterized protein n=1 Tax=Tunturiibacter gelidiferens TaxID=3069689 RepID=A0ACC5P485_9BACT|nr:hypothetical protein [Edaphobacter lichenicola]
MTEILSAGQQVYTELLNLCVWAKSNSSSDSLNGERDWNSSVINRLIGLCCLDYKSRELIRPTT